MKYIILIVILFSQNVFSQGNFKFTLTNKSKNRFFLYDMNCNNNNKCKGNTVTISKWDIKGMKCSWSLVHEKINAKYINSDTNKMILSINHGTRRTLVEFSYKKYYLGNIVSVNKAEFVHELGRDERAEFKDKINMTGCTYFDTWN